MAGASIEAALERLVQGGSVAFPTETSWGLAARASSASAVEAIRRWKGRDDGKPISLMIPSEESLADHGFDVTPLAHELMRRFWPGPLTLVLSCHQAFAPGVAGPGGAVGLRCSPHPVARRLCRVAQEAGIGLLTATSLNRSGGTPAPSVSEADALCRDGETGPLRLECGDDDAGGELPSTVIDLTCDPPVVRRWGAVSSAQLRACAGLESLVTECGS